VNTPLTGTYFKTDNAYEARIVVEGTTRFFGGSSVGMGLDTKVLSANGTTYIKVNDSSIILYVGGVVSLSLSTGDVGSGLFGTVLGGAWGFGYNTTNNYLSMGKSSTSYNMCVTGTSLVVANYATEGITLQMGGSPVSLSNYSVSAALSYIYGGVYNGCATWKIPVRDGVGGPSSYDKARTGGMIIIRTSATRKLYINVGTDTVPVWGHITIATI
jgi:hypothetical protein